MHKKNTSEKMAYYAKILIVFSITLLLYGIGLQIFGDYKLIDPVNDVTPVSEEENTISITTSDGSEVVPGNVIVNSNDKEKDKDKEKEKDTTNSDKNNNTTSNGNNTSKGNTTSSNNNNNNTNNNSNNSNNGNKNTNGNNNNNNNTANTNPVPTINETNNRLRNEIQNTYGITVRYGSETYGYTVAGISTTPIDNPTAVNSQLHRLKNALSLYPSGMFKEIKNGGIPLTIILINNYSNKSVTGVTDSSYSYANISIAAAFSFEESFYHESYHYIERYMFKKGANFNSWNTLNPANFSYGTIKSEYSYDATFSPNAYFVNNYAQDSAPEDRASTFEYMMASTKASCLNNGNTVWQKARYMAMTMEAVLDTASPNRTEYWERYL